MRSSLPLTVIAANAPQTLLSYLYVSFNSLFTCILAESKWISYAHQLRVTSPKGIQTSAYELQLPLLYSIPLIAISSLLGWLAAQSLFLVQIDIVNENHNSSPVKSILTYGYSRRTILFTIVVGSLTPLSAVLMGFRRYHPDMPLAATCSAAISAACPRPPGDVDASVLPVQ